MSILKPSALKDKITSLLQNYAHLRDDDNKLVANIWHAEIAKKGWQHSDTLKLYAAGKLTNADSITRCRRKLQEMDATLRGAKYNQRIADQQTVINDLRTNF